MRSPDHTGRQSPAVTLVRRLLALGWCRGCGQVAAPLYETHRFYAWAGDFMARDLAPHVAGANSWWQPQHLARIVRRTEKWHQT